MRAEDARLLVFDSGVGGLTVLAEIRRAVPAARLVYAADNAAFPYSALETEALTTRVVELFDRLIPRSSPQRSPPQEGRGEQS